MTDQRIRLLEKKVKALFESYADGVHFDDLYDELFELKKEVHYDDRRKRVMLPRLAEADQDRFDQLIGREGTMRHRVSDEDLHFVVQFLGSRDPGIRDRGIYFTFAEATKRHAFKKDQLNWLKDYLLLPENIYFHILEPENDGVYTRSFSWLLLSVLIAEDQEFYHVFSETDYRQILLKAVTYLILEDDGRGYDEDNGWIHVFTHMGNLLENFIFADITRADKLFLLTAVIFSYFENTYALAYGEDKRIDAAILLLLQRDKIYENSFLAMLKHWNLTYKNIGSTNDFYFYNQFYNRIRLFDSFLLFDDLPDSIRHFIKNELR